jgi:type IV pilus assembly protein PilE
MLLPISVLTPSQMHLRSSGEATRACAPGFSLIELMVTVGIVALLAAIAYPSYLRYTTRSNRSAAQSYLMGAAQKQQQILLDNRAYAPDSTTLNDAPAAAVSKFYTVTITTDTTTPSCSPTLAPPCFVLTAVPVAGTMQASDGTLTIDNTGNKSPSNLW